MTTTLPPLAESYIQATNSHDPAAFLGLFADNAPSPHPGYWSRLWKRLSRFASWLASP